MQRNSIETVNWQRYDYDLDTFGLVSKTHIHVGDWATLCDMDVQYDPNFSDADSQPVSCKRCLAKLKGG